MKFFLDESGSTGDVAKVRGALDFGQQPVFTLAAIGCRDEDALAGELRRLAQRYNLVGTELRSKNLVDIPDLTGELANFLIATDSPVFVEMVDKKFLLIINLLNTLVLPPVAGFDEASAAIPMRKILAELMAVSLPDAVLIVYARACETALRRDVETAFSTLLQWAGDADRGSMGPVLRAMIADSQADLAAATDDDAHLRFLPPPDTSVTGRSVAMLPGLSSLTNIYARINKYRGGQLADVTLVHDEHMLFGDILAEAKALMERLSDADILPILPNADYTLREHAKLVFATSAAPCIQAADVLAGFVMRFYRDGSLGRPLDPVRRMVMDTVMQLTHQPTARGINLVASDYLLRCVRFA